MAQDQSAGPATKLSTSRQTLSDCFEAARDRFKKEIADPLAHKDPKRAAAVALFLNGTKLADLKQKCEDLSTEAGEKTNKAAQLWSTLDQFKNAADAFMGFAPESVSIVWFGISSLITIGNARVQTKLLICETCDSIANIVADCVRWEARIAQMGTGEEAYEFDNWNSDVPDLVFRIFDFLWNAMPHMDQSRAKRLGSSLKDMFTKELQQKVDALLESYTQIVESAKAHFEESVFRETIQTSLKVEKIAEDLRQYLSIGSEVFDALKEQTILGELGRLRDEFQHSHTQSSRLHFSVLTDRINKITNDQGGRLASSWIFKDDAYIDWKSDSNTTTLICLRGPRGHGKSVAMMSVQKETLESHLPKEVLICHFFFKKGEQEMQRARIALESILYQLLNSRQLRKDLNAVLSVIQVLNPNFGESHGSTSSASTRSTLTTMSALCDTIRVIALAISSRVYIMLDALDECLDRREQDFAQHLKALAVATNDAGLRVIVSVRDSVDIESELNGSKTGEHDALPEELKFIEITAEKNSEDLREYLMHDVGEVLKRQINQQKYQRFFDLKLSKIVDIVHKKAKGDFTLARMVVANLQQPSKDSFEKRITQLPSAIGEIYMASLESLTPDEQDFVVNALRWTVWTVSSVTVLEVSDQYREVYKYLDQESHATKDNRTPSEEELALETENPTYDDPYERPEIKEVIYHIENAGRDFFRFNKTTGIISVDISIREWIQDDVTSGTKSAIKGSRGFNKYRDIQGNTVFNFVLTPSFVRYGDSLSELFSEREAHRTIAINILHSLNSKTFQNEYMSWTPDKDPAKRKRYEIAHWHDHIRILQKWWTKDSLDDSWWSDLLTQLSIFMRPENWHIWNLQRDWPQSGDLKDSQEHLVRLFDSPLYLACELGLPLIVDLLVHETREESISQQENKREGEFLLQANEGLKTVFFERAKIFATSLLRMNVLTSEKAEALLPELEIGELKKQLQYHKDDWIDSLSTKNPNHTVVMARVKWLEDNIHQAVSKPFNHELGQIWDGYDTRGRTSLHIAAGNPKTVRKLIEYGADINKVSLYPSLNLWQHPSRNPSRNFPKQTLLLILEDAEAVLGTEKEDTDLLPLLESASILVSEGARLDVHDTSTSGGSLLHIAAKIRNLRFFKLLCVSGNWDVHMKDNSGRTPLHLLFDGPRPRNAQEIEDSLNICRILIKMKASDKDLINAEDRSSKNALAYAVKLRFKEAVELLIELGADIHDLDRFQANCFHHLASSQSKYGPTADIAIAEILFENGLDVTKEDERGQSPLIKALIDENWELSKFFLSKQEIIASQGDINLLLRQANRGSTLFHYAAGIYTGGKEPLDFFKHLATVLAKYTDIRTLLLQPDEQGDTAIHILVKRNRLDVLEYITSTNVSLASRDSEQFTALDLSAEMIFVLTAKYFAYDVDIDLLGPTLDLRIKIFYFLLEKTIQSEFSFSFLGATIFHSPELKQKSVAIEEALRRLNVEKLVSVLTQNRLVKDIYGWSLFDALLANNLTSHAPQIAQQGLSITDGYAIPTDMFYTPDMQDLSEFIGSGHESEIEVEVPYNVLKSKQPVPPINKTFYFEVEVSLEEGVSKFDFRIGLHEECDFGTCNVTYGTDGLVKIASKRQNWADVAKPWLSGKNEPKVNSACLGCGINPLERILFFTINGKMVEAIGRVPPRRYFPAMETGYHKKGILVNFGTKPFVLAEANDPDWLWDWKIVESDWGGVKQIEWPGKLNLVMMTSDDEE